jgi:hypothetical protein
MCDVIWGLKFIMVDNIPEINVAMPFRCHCCMFPLELSIRFMSYVRHYRWQTFCTFDDVRKTEMAVCNPEVVITFV